MPYQTYLKSFALRHALCTALAVIMAVVVDYYFSFSKQGFVYFAAFCVSQTTRGTPLRQGLVLLINLFAAISLVALLSMFFSVHDALYVILTFILVCSVISVLLQLSFINKIPIIIFFFMIFILLAQPQAFSLVLLQNRMIDILMGAAIGMLCGQLVFSIRLAAEFQEGMIPVLQAMSSYLQTFSSCFLLQEKNADFLLQKRLVLESTLQWEKSSYPEWAYEIGFNPGLRSGFRFFLVNVERVAEIIFSLEYVVAQKIDAELLNYLAKALQHSIQKNQELLNVLSEYFANKSLPTTQVDYIEDIAELEKRLHEIIPGSLELLDISPDYLLLTALVRKIKDLRQLLLKLVMSLPTNVVALPRR